MNVPDRGGLARSPRGWQERPMPQTTPSEPRAGGAFIALTVVAGAVIGVAFRQPSAGVVGGAAIGIAIAVCLWLADRRR